MARPFGRAVFFSLSFPAKASVGHGLPAVRNAPPIFSFPGKRRCAAPGGEEKGVFGGRTPPEVDMRLCGLASSVVETHTNPFRSAAGAQ